MKKFIFSLSFLLLGTLAICPKSVQAQTLESTNLVCIENPRNILRQKLPDYCTTTKEDNSGLLFEGLKYTVNNSDYSTTVTGTAFNRGSAAAMIEIYDANNNLINVKIIDGNNPPTDLIRSGIDYFEYFGRAYNYPFDSRADFKAQPINFVIPKGGFVKITKSSNVAQVYNLVMFAFELYELQDGITNFDISASVSEFVKKFAIDYAQDLTQDFFLSEPNLNAMFASNLVDPEKLAQVFSDFLAYAKQSEDNPFEDVFQNLFIDSTVEVIESRLGLLGLIAKGVRKGGDYLHTYALISNLYHAIAMGDSGVVTLRNIPPKPTPIINSTSGQQRGGVPFFTASDGNISVTLTPKGSKCESWFDTYLNWHLTITKQGRTIYQKQVTNECSGQSDPLPAITIANLDNDSEPEILINLASPGIAASYYIKVYDYNSQNNTYQQLERFWGRAATYTLKDLDNDSIPEFVTTDDPQFRMVVSSNAASGEPILILRYQNGQFIDVSTQYPELLAKDAQEWKKWINQAIIDGQETGGYMLAYYADMVRLDLAYANNSNIPRKYRDEALSFLKGKPGWSEVSNKVFQHINSLYGIH